MGSILSKLNLNNIKIKYKKIIENISFGLKKSEQKITLVFLSKFGHKKAKLSCHASGTIIIIVSGKERSPAFTSVSKQESKFPESDILSEVTGSNWFVSSLK